MTDEDFEGEMGVLDEQAANTSKDTETMVRAVLLLARVLRDFHSEYVRLTP